MMCETFKEALANAVSMDTLEPMLLRLCERLPIFDDWILITMPQSLLDGDLKTIRQKLSNLYSLLDWWTIDHEIFIFQIFTFLFPIYIFFEISLFLPVCCGSCRDEFREPNYTSVGRLVCPRRPEPLSFTARKRADFGAAGRVVCGPALLVQARAVIFFDGILDRARFGINCVQNMAV